LHDLRRIMARGGEAGVPLPDAYLTLATAGAHLRKGLSSMLAGWPGSYKSTLGLNMVCRLAQQGVTGLYISAEDDKLTIAKRCVGIMSGDPLDIVEAGLKRGEYQDVLRRLSKSWQWVFHALDVPRMEDRLAAFVQKFGDFPDLLVVDNLMSMVDGPGDWKGQMTMCRDLAALAQDTGTHPLIMHHTQEHEQRKSAPPEPPPRWEIHGKVNQFPKLIFTVATEIDKETQSGILKVAVVKNNGGPDDRTGRTYENFVIDTANCRVTDIPVRDS
jgi:AAA domain-containing protein